MEVLSLKSKDNEIFDINDLITVNTYVTPRNYVHGNIIEYDILQANINILYEFDKITRDEYLYLKDLPKDIREMSIGKMIRDDDTGKIYETIKRGIEHFRALFFSYNNINLEEVIRIANDAVYINRFINLTSTRFGAKRNIEFRQKNQYRNFFRLKDYLFFMKENKDLIDVDVKGIDDHELKLHSNYMISVICNTIYMMEKVSPADAFEFISNFIGDYISLKLDKRYYREFNSFSGYRLKNTVYCLYDPESVELEDIDINYNLMILRELWSIVLDVYSNSKR